MTLARVTTWSVGQVLTSTALNAEFDNIINNPGTLITSMTGTTGDLLRATASNTWGRLGIGSTNDFLQVVAGVPAWVEAPTVTLGAIGTTSTDGLALEPTSGSSTALWSPRTRWLGFYATSTRIDWWAEVQPQAATAGAWVLSSRDNLGSTVARLTVDITNTRLNIPSGWKYAINGTQIAASDLSNSTTGSGFVVLSGSPTFSGNPNIADAVGVSLVLSTGATVSAAASKFAFVQAGTTTGVLTNYGPDASTNGILQFSTSRSDGTNTINEMKMNGGVIIGTPTGTFKGSGTLNIQGTIWTNGTQGVATFGPSAVTSITVTNGLITAIS